MLYTPCEVMWDMLVRAVSDSPNCFSIFHLQVAILSELRKLMLPWVEDVQSDEDTSSDEDTQSGEDSQSDKDLRKVSVNVNYYCFNANRTAKLD